MISNSTDATCEGIMNCDGIPYEQPSATVDTDQLVSSPGLLIETLQHHPLIVAATCVLVLIGAYVYLEQMTPLYTSTARVYVRKGIQMPGEPTEPGRRSRGSATP